MNTAATRETGAWHPWGSTLLAAAATLLLFVLPGTGAWLEYDRRFIGAGQWWRVLTSHWVHWSGDHLRWDLLAFAALAWCALRGSRLRALGTLATASVLIPAAIWVAHPDMIRYRGLSGLASALFVFVVVELLSEARTHGHQHTALLLWGMLGVFVAKVLYEIITGDTLFVQSMGTGVHGVPLAHLVGGAVGAAYARSSDQRQSPHGSTSKNPSMIARAASSNRT